MTFHDGSTPQVGELEPQSAAHGFHGSWFRGTSDGAKGISRRCTHDIQRQSSHEMHLVHDDPSVMQTRITNLWHLGLCLSCGETQAQRTASLLAHVILDTLMAHYASRTYASSGVLWASTQSGEGTWGQSRKKKKHMAHFSQ